MMMVTIHNMLTSCSPVLRIPSLIKESITINEPRTPCPDVHTVLVVANDCFCEGFFLSYVLCSKELSQTGAKAEITICK